MSRQPFLATPDAAPGNWVAHAPAAARPYLRLMRADRPIGTWLLLIPCWQGLALSGVAGDVGPHFIGYAFLFAVGAVVMRGAGCAYNDIADRDIDARVERTALRPLPAGEITVRQAWAFVIALCLLGLLILLQFNRFTVSLGIASLGLVALYPYLKRITYWPQAWLGLTFNWGALMGYAAASGQISAGAVALYAAGVFWTLGYDTIYAHQDKEDDALIGVKSTALRLGSRTKHWLAVFFAMTAILTAAAGALLGAGALYYLALAPAAVHFAWQIKALDTESPENCLRIFRSNREAGLLLLLAPILEAAGRLI